MESLPTFKLTDCIHPELFIEKSEKVDKLQGKIDGILSGKQGIRLYTNLLIKSIKNKFIPPKS